MVAEPLAIPETWPGLDWPDVCTAAFVGSEEVQVAELVTSCEVPSVRVPVALSLSEDPATTEGAAGVTAIALMEASLVVTASVVLPETAPELAVIVAVPAATPVATPGLSLPVCTVATVAGEELQVAELVRSWVELSEYLPVAVNF